MSKTVEQNFVDWESNAFGLGYGSGEIHTLGALKVFFDAVGRKGLPNAYDHEVMEEKLTAPVAWLMITILCRHDIIEYGTSPRYGWLTREGEALQAFVATKSVGELVTLVCDQTEDSVICMPDACNCGPNGYKAGRVCKNPFWPRR
jgi:hypothetical protein